MPVLWCVVLFGIVNAVYWGAARPYQCIPVEPRESCEEQYDEVVKVTVRGIDQDLKPVLAVVYGHCVNLEPGRCYEYRAGKCRYRAPAMAMIHNATFVKIENDGSLTVAGNQIETGTTFEKLPFPYRQTEVCRFE